MNSIEMKVNLNISICKDRSDNSFNSRLKYQIPAIPHQNSIFEHGLNGPQFFPMKNQNSLQFHWRIMCGCNMNQHIDIRHQFGKQKTIAKSFLLPHCLVHRMDQPDVWEKSHQNSTLNFDFHSNYNDKSDKFMCAKLQIVTIEQPKSIRILRRKCD